LDVYGGSEEKMTYNLYDVKDFLRNNIKKESDTYFGVKNGEWIDVVTNNWYDDQSNYDGRWKIIGDRVPRVGRILDMAAGCGTFALYGLHNRYDVWGVEPEEWKREYYKRKIVASNYPRNRYLTCFLNSVLELRFKIISWIKVGREENNIDLWVTKRA
jgi:hypothetical protein